MNPKAAPSLRSPRSGAVSHASSHSKPREKAILSIHLPPSLLFHISLSLPHPHPHLLHLSAPPTGLPIPSSLLLNTRKEVFVSSPSPQLCYETPSNPIRITDGRGGEAGGHGKWLPSSSFSFTSSFSFSTTDRWSSSTLVRDSLGFGSIPTLALQ